MIKEFIAITVSFCISATIYITLFFIGTWLITRPSIEKWDSQSAWSQGWAFLVLLLMFVLWPIFQAVIFNFVSKKLSIKFPASSFVKIASAIGILVSWYVGFVIFGYLNGKSNVEYSSINELFPYMLLVLGIYATGMMTTIQILKHFKKV